MGTTFPHPAPNPEGFISRWLRSEAAERANFPGFLNELCDFLQLPRPDPTQADESRNTYVFEKPVLFNNLDGTVSHGYIDLYRRNHFVLEAKQGSNSPAFMTGPEGLENFTLTSPTPCASKQRRGTAIRGTHGWDEAMLAAREQPEKYAKALPASEGWPPILITADGRLSTIAPGISSPSSSLITSLTYNQEGQLSAVNSGSSALATYTYYGFAQRAVKTISGTTGSIYKYSRGGLLLEEANSSGVAQADYIYFNGQPIAVLNGSTLSYLHDDHLGTPQLATSSTQSVDWQAQYQPFGATTSVSGTITQNLRLPGQFFDSEGGWNHNGFRDYIPSAGRYLEPDPLGFAGSGVNLYAYALNNPQGLADPGGETPCLNVNKLVNAMDTNANGKTVSGGQCAGAVKRGLVAGGIDGNSLHNGPHNYGPGLEKLGFVPIPYVKGQNFLPGDVMIFQPWLTKQGGNGHIQVWDGTQWVSDFLQPIMKDGYPGPGSTYESNDSKFQLYRDYNICP